MPISPLLAAYIGFAGLSLGALALILSLRNRYSPEWRSARLVAFLVVAASFALAPLVVMELSPTAKAVLTTGMETNTAGT